MCLLLFDAVIGVLTLHLPSQACDGMCRMHYVVNALCVALMHDSTTVNGLLDSLDFLQCIFSSTFSKRTATRQREQSRLEKLADL